MTSFISLYDNILIVDMEIEGGGHQREGSSFQYGWGHAQQTHKQPRRLRVKSLAAGSAYNL